MPGRWHAPLLVETVPSAGEVESAGGRYLNASCTDLLGLSRDPRTRDASTTALRVFGVSVAGQSKPVQLAQEALAGLWGVERVVLLEGPHGALAHLAGLGDAWAEPGVPISAVRRGGDVESLSASAPPGVLFAESVRITSGALCAGPRLAEIIGRTNSTLVLYEPLGAGVLGEHGAGVAAHFALNACHVTIARLQALGYDGWAIGGPASRLEGIAASPTVSTASVSALLKGLELSRAEGHRRTRLFELTERLIGAFHSLHLDCGPTVTPWVPLWLGDERLAREWVALLNERHVWVRAWLEPGKSRLLFSLCAPMTEAQVDQIVEACHVCMARLGGATSQPLPPAAILARPGTFAIANLALDRWHENVGAHASSALTGQAPMGLRDRLADAVETLTWRIANDRPPNTNVLRHLLEKARRRR